MSKIQIKQGDKVYRVWKNCSNNLICINASSSCKGCENQYGGIQDIHYHPTMEKELGKTIFRTRQKAVNELIHLVG